MPEFVHGGFQFGFGHLAVSHAHPGLRSELAHVFHHALQALNPVVNPENLPFALDSRSMTLLRTASSRRSTAVATGLRSCGAVSMMDSSRMPDMESCKVRGMGVAVRVSTSTFFSGL